MLGTFFVPYIVPKWVEHRVTLILSEILLSFATILVGPFYEELSLVSMCVGLGFSGFLMSFLSIPNMPEMMHATKEAHPSCDLDLANNLLSGMLNTGKGVGLALGPLLGAYFYEQTNFRTTMNIMGGITIVSAVLYLLCARGF